MQEQLAAMPPEKRKQMEAMMASRGITMPGATGGVGAGGRSARDITVKVCVTPEQAARDEMPQRDGRCQQTGRERSGNTVRFKIVCTGERPVTGEGEFTLDSDKAHHGHLFMNTVVRGKTERMEMEQSARWLSADCGDVKPHVMPPAK